MTHDPQPDDRLIAAAEAAASWARARRAKWTDRPLPAPPAEPAPLAADEPFEFEFEPQPAAPEPIAFETFAPEKFEPPPPPAVAPPVTPAKPRAKKIRAIGAPIAKWAPRIGVAAALIVGVVAVAPYAMNAWSSIRSRAATPPERKPEHPAPAPKPTAALSVTSTPSAAQVTVDGKARGVTPLELTDLNPGRHEVTLKSDAGVVRRTVTIAAGKSATIDEAIFAGWIAVYSPFEVTISDGGRVVRPDERNQIMAAPGVHELRFVNKALGFDTSRQIEVKPGEAAAVRLTPEPSTLAVTATDAAEVFLDGTRLGEVPLSSVPVPLGTHEIVVRRTSDGAERRSTVTIGVAPFVLHVDFSRPGA